MNEYPINSRKFALKFQIKSEMENINIIISAAKSRSRVKCKQSCTSSFRISYFEGRKHMSMLSAIILAILLLASCSKNASESSFHDAREALDAQKVFLSRMKSDKDLSMEHLADKISKWRTLEDSVSACLMRDTIKKAHSFPMEEFSNVHDSIRDEFMRIATAKRRTFKDVLLLKMNASPYKSKKETDSLSLVASKFFESMDTIPLYKGDKTRNLTTYHFFLEKVKKEGIANQSQFLAFLKTEDRLFRTFLSHLYEMSDVSVSHITSGTEDVCKMIAQSSRKGNLPARDAVAYMAVRTNRRIIANAQTCVADIKSGKVTSAEQRTAYFWMILQPFLSIDDFGMAMLSENQRKDLVQLSIDALGTIACLSRSLQMDKNMTDGLPDMFIKLYISSL